MDMLGLGKQLFSMYASQASKAPAFGAPADPSAHVTRMFEGAVGENKWKLSNIGGIGSDEDKDLREKAAASEDAFDNAGQTPGIEIWRVNKFEPERVEVRGDNLSLFSGDCYILLKTTELEGGQLDWHIHYWIGKDCSVDEGGSASYFTVNLDDLLGTKPVQHREVQYSESELFHSYFASVTYLDGGVDSGFKKVEPEVYEPRLMQLATTGDNVRVIQVPLQGSSLNNGDVFVLDNGLTIYQFNAENADYKERRRAMEVVEQDLKAARDGEPDLIILDGDEVFTCDPFWEVLGGKLDSLPEPSADRALAPSPALPGEKKLFRISDESGDMIMSMEKEGDLQESDINEEDNWAIASHGQCYIYIGSNCSKDEKFYVWSSVSEILLAAGLDASVNATVISKESDPSTWNALF